MLFANGKFTLISNYREEKKKKEMEEIKLKEEERVGKDKIKHQEEITRY